MQKIILVTGANSGIGLHITQLLSEGGHTVYAGSRNVENFTVFEGMEHVIPIQLDVTSDISVQQAFNLLKQNGDQLDGLINNAGVSESFPLIYSTVADFTKIFDVNIFGIQRMVTQFADMIIETKGRIVNIGSISGILSSFASGVYSMTKHAVEAYSDTLFVELKGLGVHVAIVEPGNYQSNIGSGVNDILERMEKIVGHHYQEAIKYLKTIKDNPPPSSPEPVAVAKAVLHALTDENPKRRYLVTDNQMETDWVMNQIIGEALQLNENHKFQYSKEKLLELVDQMYGENPLTFDFKKERSL